MSYIERISEERLAALKSALQNDISVGATHRLSWLRNEIAWIESERAK